MKRTPYPLEKLKDSVFGLLYALVENENINHLSQRDILNKYTEKIAALYAKKTIPTRKTE